MVPWVSSQEKGPSDLAESVFGLLFSFFFFFSISNLYLSSYIRSRQIFKKGVFTKQNSQLGLAQKN